VAEVRPLRLKAEPSRAREKIATELPFVRVLINPPAPHMEPYLDYTVPISMSGSIGIGSLVEVPFNNTTVPGVVVDRIERSDVGGRIKPVSKLLGETPITTSHHLAFIASIAQRYGVAPWEFFKQAIPSISVTALKNFMKSAAQDAAVTTAPFTSELPADMQEWLAVPRKILGVLELPLHQPYWESAAEIARFRSLFAPVIMVVPDERDIRVLGEIFLRSGLEVLTLSSDLKKTERFFRYLQLTHAHFSISITTRNGVLADLPIDASIIVLDDADPSHYDRRSPGWNTRDVALARKNEHSVIFLSTAPSLELVAMAERSEIAYYSAAKTRTPRITYTREDDSKSFFPVITRGIKRGRVLVRSGSAGYVQSFSCQKCRNAALCSCGGKLIFTSSIKDPLCSVCDKKYIDWACSFCGNRVPRITRAGVERLADEYARSFPNVPVFFSKADHVIDEVSEVVPALYFSTAGVEPYGRYESIVILDLESSLMHTSLRATEYLRLEVFRLLTLLNHDGELYISLPQGHSFAQELTQRTSRRAASREIHERDSAHLPPHFRLITIDCEGMEPVISSLKDFVDSRGVEIIGPIARKASHRLFIKAPRTVTPELITRLREVNRVLSMRKAALMRYYIDPYDLDY